jgi:hypothetical protein
MRKIHLGILFWVWIISWVFIWSKLTTPFSELMMLVLGFAGTIAIVKMHELAIKHEMIKEDKQDRETFQSFIFHETANNPTLNLDDALNLYIEKHGLMIRTCLDEPDNISTTRTKLQIMEEMLSNEPDYGQNSQFTDYIANLRRTVDAFNSLTPEYIKHLMLQSKI